MMLRFAAMLFPAALGLATPSQAGAQELDRRAELVSAQGGRAEAGDAVMIVNVTTALPNIFGRADIFGRRRDAGQTVVQYVGIRDGVAIFLRQSVLVHSNETTMSRTPIIIPNNSNTFVGGYLGTQPFNGTATTYGTTVIQPRASSRSEIALAPVQLAVPQGGKIRVEGYALTVLNTSPDGSITFSVK